MGQNDVGVENGQSKMTVTPINKYSITMVWGIVV
jgi:hypothetical protein